MIQSIKQNVKQDIFSLYFAASVILVLCVCLFSPGLGIMDNDYVTRPMIIEELLQHSKADFIRYMDIYNCNDIFFLGMRGFLYVIFPLLSMASVNRYCEEQTTGFRIQKMVRTGRRLETISNLLAASFSSVLAVLSGLGLFLICLAIRLPFYKLETSVILCRMLFVCLLTVMGTCLSVFIAALTRNKFYSFVIPVLLFYAENEFLMGLCGGTFSGFAIQVLMNPGNKTISVIGVSFMVIVIFALCLAVARIERGRYEIGV